MRKLKKIPAFLSMPEPDPIVERDDVEEFVKAFLSGGPILRTYVCRESENAGLSWEDVRLAFQRLNGREYVQKGDYFWRIFPE